MNISRRKFLQAAPVVAAVAGFGGAALAQRERSALPSTDSRDALAAMSFLSFHQYLNTQFIFKGNLRTEVPLSLYAIQDARPKSKQKWGEGPENFVLKFSGSSRNQLTQGTYGVEHFGMGEFDLFITEGGTLKSRTYYVAVINRVTDSSGR